MCKHRASRKHTHKPIHLLIIGSHFIEFEWKLLIPNRVVVFANDMIIDKATNKHEHEKW